MNQQTQVATREVQMRYREQPGLATQLVLLWAGVWTADLLSSPLAWNIQWSYDPISTLCVQTRALTCWVNGLRQYVPKFHVKNKMVLSKLTSLCFLKEDETCVTADTGWSAVKVWVLISWIFVTELYSLSGWEVHLIVMQYNFIWLVCWV